MSMFSFTFNAPNDTAAFVSVAGDEFFDRLDIRETIGGNENDFYGRVYTCVSAVTEPSPLAAMGVIVAWPGPTIRNKRKTIGRVL